jgi:hypothetical protein
LSDGSPPKDDFGSVVYPGHIFVCLRWRYTFNGLHLNQLEFHLNLVDSFLTMNLVTECFQVNVIMTSYTGSVVWTLFFFVLRISKNSALKTLYSLIHSVLQCFSSCSSEVFTKCLNCFLFSEKHLILNYSFC